MAQNILTSKGTVIPKRTIHHLTRAEIHSKSEKRKRSLFNDMIHQKLGNSLAKPPYQTITFRLHSLF